MGQETPRHHYILPATAYPNTIRWFQWTPFLNVVTVAAKRKVFSIFSVTVLNFTVLEQQLTIKSLRFWHKHLALC